MNPNKVTFHTRLGSHELPAEHVLCNDVVLPGESHPHGMRLWVVGDTLGNFERALGAVWANNEQDALDELVDAGLGASFLVSDADYKSLHFDEREELSVLGNAGEWADLSNAWLAEVLWDPARDLAVLLRFAEARGACDDTLDA